MEVTTHSTRTQHYYNPWVLQLLYHRVVYRSELLALVPPLTTQQQAWEGGRAARYVTQNTEETLVALSLERQPCDAAWLCVEQALYRLAALFRPHDLVFQEGPAASAIGAPFACELALSVESNQQREIVYGAVQRFVQNRVVPFGQPHLPLLLNMKHALEKEAPRGTSVQWDQELCMALMYCYLLDSLHTDLQIEHTSYQFRGDTVGDGLRTLQTLKDEMALFRALHNVARTHLKSALQHAIYEQPSTSRVDPNARYRLKHATVVSVVCVQSYQNVVLGLGSEESPRQHRYLQLSAHSHCYQHVVQRLLLDYTVQRECLGCHSCTANQCRLLAYMQRHEALRDFYDLALLPADEADLGRVLVEQQGSVDAVLWRSVLELQAQFDALEEEHDVTEYNALTRRAVTRRVPTRLLHMVDLDRLLTETRQQCRLKHLVAESETVLLAIACTQPERLTLAHRTLASQIVVIEALLGTVSSQFAQAEQLTRSQSPDLLLCQDDAQTRLHRDVQLHLVQLYNSYRNALRDAVIQL